ncbi:DUF6243 family protein [Streptomyces sp. NPDC057854]|uniref:DUF6243 family protein n=1 Tax=unclassified Streptomyces TaxID=2593676 RepID=UPI0036B092FA
MAKGRNNLLGVGGQRKKLSRADQQGAQRDRAADRRTADEKKQDLLKKMRERSRSAESGDSADTAATADSAAGAATADSAGTSAE